MGKKVVLLFGALLMLVAGLRVLAAPAPDPEDDGMRDDKALQGTWQMASASFGEKGAEKEIKDVKLIVDGKQFTLRDRKDETVTFKLDPKKKPREIDLSPPGEKDTVLGIYKVEKDTFTLCFIKGGKERPKEFSSKGGATLLVFKREKK